MSPRTLADCIPQTDTDTESALVSGFLDYISDTGLSLYPAQEEAILEIMAGRHVILNTPTGSGKSLVATAMHFKAVAERKKSFYTSPIKALVSEKFFALCQQFGASRVGMMTGDATINRDAPIICCTAEILSNMALGEGVEAPVDYAIIDEFHYYSDKERGMAWQIPLLMLPQTTFLLMSATMGHSPDVIKSIEGNTGREVVVVKSSDRPVPLDFTYKETPLHETLEDLIKSRKYPIYLVNFTQRECVEEAQNAMSVDICTREEKQAILQALRGFRFDSPFGKDMRRFIAHGIGLHHAGLLPKYRLLVEKLSQLGLLKIIMGTDTLGVGVNIPIRTVLFTKLCKFDGEKVTILSVRDFKQISGRAGRKGFDDQGSVVCQAPEHVIENKRMDARTDDPKKKRKLVKKKPPTKGYVHWDEKTFERLIDGDPEPLQSVFQVTHNLILTMLQSTEGKNGYRALISLIRQSHESERAKARHIRAAAVLFRSLRRAGIVSVVRNRHHGARLALNFDLQDDFSLHHALSLYLLETLPLLDRDAPDYAYDVLTLVESILENPHQVLFKQVDRAKTERMDQMRAEGLDYEARMAELEKIEYPKPNAEFIYATFNEFERQHPWVGQENIKPKSVVREMVETCASFHEYVRDYGLQRSEGVLLRYLFQAYKTLMQNVPDTFKTDEVRDIEVFLRVMLGRVDSSLVEEWEQLLSPSADTPDAEVTLKKARHPFDPAVNPKAFRARVRTELHTLIKALAYKDYENALTMIYREDDGQEQAEANAGGWTKARLESTLQPYFAEYGSIDVTPHTRRPEFTVLKKLDDGTWQAQQIIVDPQGDNQWTIETNIVIDEALSPNDPLIRLTRIGV